MQQDAPYARDETKDIHIRPGCKGKKKQFFTQYFSESIPMQAPESSAPWSPADTGGTASPWMHPTPADSLGNA
jgi:hypothetical protein